MFNALSLFWFKALALTDLKIDRRTWKWRKNSLLSLLLSELNFKSVKHQARKPQIKMINKTNPSRAHCGPFSVLRFVIISSNKEGFYDLARTGYFVQCKKPRRMVALGIFTSISEKIVN